MSLATQLRAAREAAGLSQEALARLAGVSAFTVSHIERGRSTESRGAVEKIAKALGVRVERSVKVVPSHGGGHLDACPHVIDTGSRLVCPDCAEAEPRPAPRRARGAA